jgi:hypothetical protein
VLSIVAPFGSADTLMVTCVNFAAAGSYTQTLVTQRHVAVSHV